TRLVLYAVQECGFNPSKDCLAPTVITPTQGAAAGIANPTNTVLSGTTLNYRIADMNGDGHEDLIYAVASGGSNHWWVKFGTASGFGAAVDTTLVTTTTDQSVEIDDFLAEGTNSLLASQGATWYLVRWNRSTGVFTSTNTGVSVPNGGAVTQGQCATAD